MFEPFRAAPGSAKIATILILLFIFLSWVATMVTFGSVLHRMSETLADVQSGTPYTFHYDFYWDHYVLSSPNPIFNGNNVNAGYNDGTNPVSEWIGSNTCKSGGDATLAFAIFAFLAFLIHIPLAFTRVAGFSFPLARDTQHSLYIELVLTAIELFCFFLMTTIWGGTCYSPSRSTASVTGVGYGLIIACFFFLIINLVLYLMMRSNDNLVLGNGATRGGGGGAYGNEGGGYSGGGQDGEYSGGDNASQPTFSYQGGESSGNTL